MGDAGVEVHVEGNRCNIERFILDLKSHAPPVSEVADVQVEWTDCSGDFHEFSILASDEQRSPLGSMIPPDIGLCDRCTEDILNMRSRWNLYPFTCCASCGPRFTAVLQLPYDRDRTNMLPFPMCPNCLREYEDARDRRFHAQGVCCHSCGPKITLHDRSGRLIDEVGALEKTSHLLDEGAIIGVKGIGGIHVAASAVRDDALLRIRRRKHKPSQPFAVMSRSLDTIREFAYVSDSEAQLLGGWRRPIVLLRKRRDHGLSDLVGPGLDTVGAMLPYTGIHLLLTEFCRSPALVMTSGNISGLPMAIAKDQAIQELSDVVDYFLFHDREIVARCDDSVVRLLSEVPTLIRRSRGFVPTPIAVPLKAEANIIGVGAELRLVGSVLRGDQCYLTQHIGDVDNLETMVFLQDALEHVLGLAGIPHNGLTVSHDAHPRYLTSKLAKDLARDWSGKTVWVQHHHAHAASLMAENMVPADESIVAVAADGVGFGLDGDVWGGEILVASYASFERVGHLARQPMPGGDACAIFPLRMCAAMLSPYLDDKRVRSILLSKKGRGALKEDDLDRLEAQLRGGLGVSWTSSTGRVLDAMAAGTGVCLERTYEGEPAMRLEAVAGEGNPEDPSSVPSLLVRDGGVTVVDTTRMLLETLLAIGRISIADACASFQQSLAGALGHAATEAARDRGISQVGVTGGVAVNIRIVETIKRCVEEAGLDFLQHRLVPPGDGGISLGQAVVAASKL